MATGERLSCLRRLPLSEVAYGRTMVDMVSWSPTHLRQLCTNQFSQFLFCKLRLYLLFIRYDIVILTKHASVLYLKYKLKKISKTECICFIHSIKQTVNQANVMSEVKIAVWKFQSFVLIIQFSHFFGSLRSQQSTSQAINEQMLQNWIFTR